MAPRARHECEEEPAIRTLLANPLLGVLSRKSTSVKFRCKNQILVIQSFLQRYSTNFLSVVPQSERHNLHPSYTNRRTRRTTKTRGAKPPFQGGSTIFHSTPRPPQNVAWDHQPRASADVRQLLIIEGQKCIFAVVYRNS